MAEILNKYKRWKPRLIINREKEIDFVLSQDNSFTVDIDANLTKKCLISYIDTNKKECVNEGIGLSSSDEFKYENGFNNGVEFPDFGFTATDNGGLRYDKDKIDLTDFIGIITGSTLNITSGDTRLHLYEVYGNSQYYDYNCGVKSDDKDTYYSFNGGFLQGFYNLYGADYSVLPTSLVDTWNLEFVIRPRTDYVESGNTLNSEHPENKGIFFYMGTRSENKFGRFYGEDLSKYPYRKGFEDNCFDLCEDDSKEKADDYKNFMMWLWNFYHGEPTDKNLCKCCEDSGDTHDDDVVSSLTQCTVDLSTSEGHKLDSNKYFEITTDNKFLIFDRTKDGYTVHTWDDENELSIIQKKLVGRENLFLLMDRTRSGYTVNTIEKYFDSLTGQSEDYSIMNDVKDNAFALKLNDDGSVGYKYLIKDCDNEKGYSIKEEKTFAGKVVNDQWNVINVMFKILDGGVDKCGNSLGNRKMKIYIYVNGYLKLVSQELPEFRFRELNDFYDKQEGVPFNISLGGGTQGLSDSMWTDNYTRPYCKILPLEENFGGSFIGDIRSFKFYNCQMQYNEIKNNFLFETGGHVEPKEDMVKDNIIYYGFGVDYMEIVINGSQMGANKNIRNKYVSTSTIDDSHFYVVLSKKYIGSKPSQFTCGGAPMVMFEEEKIIDGKECIVYKSGEIYAPDTELIILSDNL